MMLFVVSVGFLSDRCIFSSLFSSFTALALVLRLRGACSCAAMFELLDGCPSTSVRVDRFQLIPRFDGSAIIRSSLVMLLLDLRLRPPLLQVPTRKPVRRLRCDGSTTPSCSHRLVLTWTAASTQEARMLVPRMCLTRKCRKSLRRRGVLLRRHCSCPLEDLIVIFPLFYVLSTTFKGPYVISYSL
uniref:Uncharacterized protein n=1 Tax=Arundo donax TaxID=35708 RepID=A0A0A8ZSG1_ARUDO